ncbi:MAG: DUF2867 domain-containing protein [Roseiarcus sp.]
MPSESALHPTLAVADFYDAYAAPLSDARLTPTEIFLRAVRATPPWVSRLMSIRNFVVRRLGLEDVGAMDDAADKPADAYEIGDRLGIFTIFGMSDNELVLGIDDRHLDVRVSVSKSPSDRPRSYIVSTVVKTHNRLGRLYMTPVGRIHPFVVRSLMRRTVV